jgi:hypothetical protein
LEGDDIADIESDRIPVGAIYSTEDIRQQQNRCRLAE